MDESDDFFDRAAKWYLISRFLLACFGMILGMIAGVSFVVYWVCNELSLESSYRHKYGADWKAEFEHYHGSLSHAHTQMTVCVVCMIALVVVLSWFCHKTFHKHKHRNQPAPASLTPKSELVPIGVLLMFVGLVGRYSLAKAFAVIQPSTLREVLYLIATDGLSMAGAACALIGWLRDRRTQRPPED